MNERRTSGLEFIGNNRENAAFKTVFDDTPKEAGEKEVKGANIDSQDPLRKSTPSRSLRDGSRVQGLYAINAGPIQNQHDRCLLKNAK